MLLSTTLQRRGLKLWGTLPHLIPYSSYEGLYYEVNTSLVSDSLGLRHCNYNITVVLGRRKSFSDL